VSLERIQAVHEGALLAYVEENYDYNFAKLLSAEAKLQGDSRPTEIVALYERTFAKKEFVHKQLAVIMKRVEKHLTEESVKVRLLAIVKEKTIEVMTRNIHKVLPDKVLTPWPQS